MEQMPPAPGQQSLFQLNVDPPAHFMLRSTASWARVMAICGIIMGIIFLTYGFLFQNAINQPGSSLEGYLGDRKISSSERSGVATIYLVIFIIIGLIFLISGLFALSFSNRISTALKANDSNSLRSGFAAARNYFAFRTIILIICLLFLLLGIIGILNQPGNTGRFD